MKFVNERKLQMLVWSVHHGIDFGQVLMIFLILAVHDIHTRPPAKCW